MGEHSSYQESMDKRRAKFLAQPAVEYGGGPVFDEDFERYYESLDSLVDARWDDGETYENAMVFECRTDKAHTPNLYDAVNESWADEVEDYWDAIPKVLEAKLYELQKELEAAAPDVWYPDYSRRLEFDYSGYPPVED